MDLFFSSCSFSDFIVAQYENLHQSAKGLPFASI